MRPVRSPAAPKITITQGSPCFPIRGGTEVGCSAVSAMNRVLWIDIGNEPRLRGLLCLVCALFHVSAELLSHGGKHLLGEGMLLPRPEAHVQSGSQDIRRHRFVECRLDRPAALARILHV